MIKTVVQNQVFIQVLLMLLYKDIFIQKVADPDLPSTCTLLISPNTGAKVKFDIILIISIEFYHALEQRESLILRRSPNVQQLCCRCTLLEQRISVRRAVKMWQQ